MDEQRNPNSKPRIFDDLRNSLFFSRIPISFDVDRAVGERLDEIIDELCDHLSDEMREEFTRAKLCELCLASLIDEYENNKPASLLVRVIGSLRQPVESE